MRTSSPPTLRDVAERAGVSVSTVTRVLKDSPLAGEASRQKVLDAIAELGYVEPDHRPVRPTITDVARAAGVSITTVSRVLGDSGQVQERTRAKVLAVMDSLDFVANGHARALNRQGLGQVALLSASMLGPAFVGIAQGIESVVSPRGHQFVVHTTGDDPSTEAAHVATLREQRAQAVVFLGGVEADGAYRDRMAGYARALGTVGSRLVLCARPPVAGLPTVPGVDYDNAGGTRAVTEHLISLGHVRIGFVGGRPMHSTVIARVDGYAQAMEAAGLAPVIVPTVDWEAEDGETGTRELWERHGPVTAVVAARDLVAVGVIRELRRRGVRVPDDVSVAGFDDLPLTADLTPPLSTVRTPMRLIGETVAQFALAREAGEEVGPVVLPVEVLLRGSTAAPPA